MNIEIRQKDDSISWEELTNLFHEAFQERLDQGLHFTCSYFTPEDLERRSANNTVLVAIDNDVGKLVGTVSIEIINDDNGIWAHHLNLAVKPEYKGQGIATLLLKRLLAIAKANGCDYVISDTAVGAKSSVRWHLKNGFRIIELISWKSTNYYSYVFRQQLVHDSKWSNPLYCKLHFLKNSIQCRMYHLENGEDRKSKWLDLYLKIRGAK